MRGTKRDKKRWKRTRIQNLLRNSESGRFYARFKVGGKQKWVSLKTDVYSVAKLRLADIMKEERKRQGSTAASVTGKMTVGDAVEVYRQSIASEAHLKPNSKLARLNAITKVERSWPDLARKDVRRVSKADCKKWAARYLRQGTGFVPPGAKGASRNGGSASSFNKAKDTLRRVFDVAVEAGAIYENPVAGIKRATEKPKELSLPSRAQFYEMVKAVEASGAGQAKDCAELVQGLAFSGCRIGEARALRWADVDFKKKLVRRVEGKTLAATRFFPMVPELEKLLRQIRKERKGEPLSARVFRVGECQKSLDRAATVVEIDRITHHDLRHFFITTAIESGVDIPTISRWVGHKDGGALLMRRYGHLRDEHSKTAAKRVSFRTRDDQSEKVVEFENKELA